jgi:hypothetical protein
MGTGIWDHSTQWAAPHDWREAKREGDPNGWSSVLITAQETGPPRPIVVREKETLKGGDPTVPITALDSWGKPVFHEHI